MDNRLIIIISLLGGVIPAFFWLWFWVREDRLKPEPRGALASAFIGGSVAVFVALFLEMIIYYIFADAGATFMKDLPGIITRPLESLSLNLNLVQDQSLFWANLKDFFHNLGLTSIQEFNLKQGLLVIIIAPIIEEVTKFLFTYHLCLRRKVNDEPVDASIYMLTAALGFAAIETAIFISEPISGGKVFEGLMASNVRSIGPMLIHIISSATIGLFLGLAFYKSRIHKFLYFLLGLIIAIILHAIFNTLIVLNDIFGNDSFFWYACLFGWLLILMLLLFFRKVKAVIRPTVKTSLWQMNGQVWYNLDKSISK